MLKQSRLKTFLQQQKNLFRGQGVESPDLSAELLLAEALGLARSELLKLLILEPKRAVKSSELQALEAMAARRLNGEPTAYILGEKEFYGRPFKVTPAVLIPRPETELLIDTAKECFKGQISGKFADLGTGSGCIAATLALELGSGWHGLALEKSAAALEVAGQNIAALGAAPQVALASGDFNSFAIAPGSLDLLVSNPPYISEDEYLALDKGVRAYEPKNALVPAGHTSATGDEDLVTIALLAGAALKSGGILIMEMGCSQREAMREFFNSRSEWRDFQIIKDLAGLDRLVLALRS